MGLLVLLREFWDIVVFPIVKIHQEFHPNRSRIWWRPTIRHSSFFHYMLPDRLGKASRWEAQALEQSKLVAMNAELSSIPKRVGSVATLTCVQDQDPSIVKVAEGFGTNDSGSATLCIRYDYWRRGESGGVHPSCCSHAVCRISFCDWDDVDDGHTNEITSRFITTWQMNPVIWITQAALALHRTMNSLRSKFE
ncbi:hypothetical protein HD554DRAFT_2042890 [Boletus coccyginus]|nr:hypothetical protein HD554DRAFT_2042890 [Boletus coccyginus]